MYVFKSADYKYKQEFYFILSNIHRIKGLKLRDNLKYQQILKGMPLVSNEHTHKTETAKVSSITLCKNNKKNILVICHLRFDLQNVNRRNLYGYTQ